MATITSKNLHRNVREVLDFVRFENGRVTITRRGRPIAVLVPFERRQEAIAQSKPQFRQDCKTHPQG